MVHIHGVYNHAWEGQDNSSLKLIAQLIHVEKGQLKINIYKSKSKQKQILKTTYVQVGKK